MCSSDLTEAQNLAFMAAIKAPTLYIEGDNGLMAGRLAVKTRLETIENLQPVFLAGGHHLHLEEVSCQAVTATITRFLTE